MKNEELPQMLRECGAAHCEDCKLREDFDCFCNLAFAAADEIERLRSLEEAVGRTVFLSARSSAGSVLAEIYRIAELLAASFLKPAADEPEEAKE